MGTTDSEAAFWETVYAASDDEMITDTLVDEVLVELADDLDPGTALDLGCGTGQNTCWLAIEGWDTTGVDISPSAIELARKRADQADLEISFEAGDARTWQPRRQFDLVFSTHAMPSTESGRRDAIRTAVSAVKVGGTLYIREFDRSFADGDGPFKPEELTNVDEIVSELDGFSIALAEVQIMDHSHGDVSMDAPCVVVLAVRDVKQ